ncbi:unnamed protein product [Prorocentrum cordatum]|uniref:Armadillo repeat-containing protein 1 n=1 Tax=Prorocentrum cordatum TaxID=2364126 RepID=A0ABN9Q5V4_9DINO|nr:unnamed protein product [Polarella glacialis]
MESCGEELSGVQDELKAVKAALRGGGAYLGMSGQPLQTYLLRLSEKENLLISKQLQLLQASDGTPVAHGGGASAAEPAAPEVPTPRPAPPGPPKSLDREDLEAVIAHLQDYESSPPESTKALRALSSLAYADASKVGNDEAALAQLLRLLLIHPDAVQLQLAAMRALCNMAYDHKESDQPERHVAGQERQQAPRTAHRQLQDASCADSTDGGLGTTPAEDGERQGSEVAPGSRGMQEDIRASGVRQACWSVQSVRLAVSSAPRRSSHSGRDLLTLEALAARALRAGPSSGSSAETKTSIRGQGLHEPPLGDGDMDGSRAPHAGKRGLGARLSRVVREHGGEAGKAAVKRQEAGTRSHHLGAQNASAHDAVGKRLLSGGASVPGDGCGACAVLDRAPCVT